MVEKTDDAGARAESFWPALYDPFRTFGARVSEWLSPAAEASAEGDDYRIAVELPGVGEDDIDISVADGVVTVKGEKETTREDKGETWFFSERQYGSFRRSFRLPADADADAVEAGLKDGVLTIRVPRKAAKAADARKVKVARE